MGKVNIENGYKLAVENQVVEISINVRGIVSQVN